MPSESSEEPSPAIQTINLKQRLKDLDHQRLAQLPDHDLVAIINQRRYYADLKAEDEWKKKHTSKRKKLRFQRNK
jgi:hypothetical protein